APGPASRPGGVRARVAACGDLRVRDPEALEPQPVVGDEVVERGHLRKRVPDPLDLGSEPWVNPLRTGPEVEPWRDSARLELSATHRLQERLGEGPADAHRFAYRLHLRAVSRLCARD